MNNTNQELQQNMEAGCGLTRYRSAPSSYLLSLLSNSTRDLSYETGDATNLFNHITSTTGIVDMPPTLPTLPPPPPPLQRSRLNPQHLPSQNSEPSVQQNIDLLKDNSFESFWGNPVEDLKIESGHSHGGLIRHSSSPAGLFADINMETEFSHMREMGSFGAGNNAQFPWNNSNSLLLSDDFLTGFIDEDNQKEEQIIKSGKPLSHHLSLPRDSLEKLLQDSVPCKIRARRGCATHPRSIAERVRRTKISERMRKLQELVPNMDKQTSTSDMLELAVDYIKDLQRQVKTLREDRDKCSCSEKKGR